MTPDKVLIEAEVEILLIEDNSSDAELAVRELRRHKFANNIVVIDDGAEAMDFVFCRGIYASRSFTRPPKLILLDVKLPKVDGLQILAAIKKDPRTRAIPVVIMTSSDEERDLVESYQLGGNAFIQKPVDFDEFRIAIERVGMFWIAVNKAPPMAVFESTYKPNTAPPVTQSTSSSISLGSSDQPL